MVVPLQQLISPEQDLLYQQMRAAYEGDTDVWRAVTLALRDAIVDHARTHSPYYRERIPVGARFEDIPILTKADLREHLDDLLAEGVPEERRFPDRSSGSTGQPVDFFRDTAQQLAHTSASDKFFRWLHGVPLDATIVAVQPTRRPEQRGARLPGWRAVGGRLGSRLSGRPAYPPWVVPVPTVDLWPADLPREIRRWGRLGPYFLLAQASALDWIADQIERRGIEIPTRPVAVATNQDLLTEPARARIERVFGVPVHTRYSSREHRWIAASVPGTIDRYLFNPLLVYVEILGDDGRPVAPGHRGRVVLTDLHNRVMPFIRYDQGDIGVASGEGYIGGFPLVEAIQGRSSEIVVLPSGKALTGAAVADMLFLRHDFQPWVRSFQCAQTDLNELELRVVWETGPDEQIRRRMAQALREVADPDTVVRVRDIEDLDRLPSGKAWIVRQELDARGR